MAFLLLQTAQLAATKTINWRTQSQGGQYDEITIESGDSLRFEWSGGHDVFKVNSKSDFDNCDTGMNPPSNRLESGNSKKVTTTPDVGTHYYICTYGNHCSWGQKIKVTVTAKAEANPYCHASCPQSLSGTEDEPVTELDQSDGNRYGYRHVDEDTKDCTCDLQSCSPFRSTTAAWFRFAGTSGSMIATCPVTAASPPGAAPPSHRLHARRPPEGVPAERTSVLLKRTPTTPTRRRRWCAYRDGGVTTSCCTS